jgi:hypothetical protein
VKTNRKNIVGLKVKKARLRKKPAMSQLELSEKLASFGVQIDRAGIAKIETGIRCVYDFELPALAKVLGVSVNGLLKVSRR